MINVNNWDETKKHLEAFWNKDYYERCNLSIVLKNPNTNYVSKYNSEDFSVEEKYMNSDYVYERCLAATKNSLYFGEAFPVHYTNFGTAAHCTYFGCRPDYAKSTVWFNPCVDEPEVDLLKFDENNCPEFEKQKAFMADISKKAQGQFMVGMNDNCGITDALGEIRGTDNLLMDLLTDPDFVKAAIAKISEVWKKTQNEFFSIIKENNDGGSSHGWMNTWHKGRHAQIQCDFSVMISPEHFEEYILPELIDTSSFLDATSYHLDGQEQIRHLDMILSVKTIDNIQWTPVAGQPLTSEFIPTLQRIQKAGKGLILVPKPHEIPILMEQLSQKGRQIVANGIEDASQAEDLLRLAKKLAH